MHTVKYYIEGDFDRQMQHVVLCSFPQATEQHIAYIKRLITGYMIKASE